MRSVTVVGFDPGFEFTGWAALAVTPGEDGTILTPLGMGVWRTEKGRGKILLETDRMRRTAEHTAHAVDVFNRFNPLCVISETPSHVRSASVMFGQGIVYGVLAAVCATRSLPFSLIPPMALKDVVTGVKTASKLEVQAALDERFGMHLSVQFLKGLAKGKWEHAYDALGAALAASQGDLVKIGLQAIKTLKAQA